MAAVTPIRPRAIIRLWDAPNIFFYERRSFLTSDARNFYGLGAGAYGYGRGSPLGLDSFFDGSRASFSQVATLRRLDSFSMTQEENGIGQWAAVYS